MHFQTKNYTTDPGASLRNALIRQLDAFSTYVFSVREQTSAGWGPYSDVVYNKTLEGSKSKVIFYCFNLIFMMRSDS